MPSMPKLGPLKPASRALGNSMSSKRRFLSAFNPNTLPATLERMLGMFADFKELDWISDFDDVALYAVDVGS